MSKDIALSLSEEHRRLQEMRTVLLDARDRYLANGDERGWNLASRQLREFASHVDRHFSFEEEEGFLVHVTQHRPHLSKRVGTLRADHEALRNALLDLVALLDTKSEDGLRRHLIGARLNGILNRLEAHEREENALMQEAFQQDFRSDD